MAQATTDQLNNVCGEEPRFVCRWVFEQTSSEFWARVADWAIDRTFTILLIVVVALVVGRLLRRSVRKAGRRAVARADAAHRASGQHRPGAAGEAGHARAIQRVGTLTSVLTSLVTGVVWVVAGLLVLGQLGITLGPLLAGAGVVGVVLAFGAQHVVADFLAGWFMLTEDQFGVGDIVDLGEVAGTPVAGVVEAVSLRVTTVRDVNGTLWHVPNSEILRVANKSQLWSRAVLDIEVAYDTELRRAQQVIQDVADGLWQDETFTAGRILERPEVWGVETFGPDGVAIRLVVKTAPADQFAVARELRLRLKEALDAEGVEIPFPQRTVWVRQDNGIGGPVPGLIDEGGPGPSGSADLAADRKRGDSP